jgi:hypothetical protein
VPLEKDMQDEVKVWVCEICGANVPVRVDLGHNVGAAPARVAGGMQAEGAFDRE